MDVGLQGSRNPFSDYPSYKAIAHKSLEERVAIMRDHGFRTRLLAEEKSADVDAIARALESFEMIFPLGKIPNYEPRADELESG